MPNTNDHDKGRIVIYLVGGKTLTRGVSTYVTVNGDYQREWFKIDGKRVKAAEWYALWRCRNTPNS